jgi:hypothetical protein
VTKIITVDPLDGNRVVMTITYGDNLICSRTMSGFVMELEEAEFQEVEE